ncbi:hypothetical protein BUE80_DR008292 [Diplocarpon rosae]|nr:hypothetical protein BUE80_DR008292 [Diplocarpon rosae]
MRSAQLFALMTMAVGVMAKCGSAPEWCGSSSTADPAYPYGYECDSTAENDVPCDGNPCILDGGIDAGDGHKAMKCCKFKC